MLAVLIDADNLSADLATKILDWCRSKAPLLAVRVFGDFSSNRNAEWCELARRNGYELVFQPNGGTGKNSTDIALTINAMDLLQEGVATAFCLASNDRDFVPLASRLRRSGRTVFAAGQKLDHRVKANCHDYLQIAAVPKVAKVVAMPAAPLANVPPLVAAFRKVSNGSDRLSLSQLSNLLRVHSPEIVPKGSGKLRKTLLESGWFEEKGKGSQLTISLKRQA